MRWLAAKDRHGHERRLGVCHHVFNFRLQRDQQEGIFFRNRQVGPARVDHVHTRIGIRLADDQGIAVIDRKGLSTYRALD